MPEKNTENVESGLNKENGVVSSTGSRLEKMENNKNSKIFSGGDIVSTDKLKKGFTATQKVIAFFGSILSLIVAGFTVNNLMNGKPAKPTDNNTPTTSVVKIIEKSHTSSEQNSDNTSSATKDKETKPSTNHNAEEKKSESNDKTSDSSSPREKEIVREIIREVPATTTTNVVEQDSSSNTDPSTKSSGEDNHPKSEGETKPSLSEGKSE